MAGSIFCDLEKALDSVIRIYMYIASNHSAPEHRASTRILRLTLFVASVLISAQVLLTPLASSSTVLRHVFLGLPLPRLPLVIPLCCLSGYDVGWFPQCMPQPFPLPFPDLQIYSGLLRALL